MDKPVPPVPPAVPALTAEDQAAQFRLLADNVPVLIAVFDAATRTCRFANRQYARGFGLDEVSVLGRTFAQIIGEEAAQEIEPHVQRVLQERVSVSYERRLERRDGSPRWIEVNLIPYLPPGADAVQSSFVLISDITRFREAEMAVRDSEERLAKFMQASMEGIVFHRDGVMTDVNPPICELVGYSLDEMIGRPALSMIAPDQIDTVRAVMEAGHETRYPTAILHRNGERIEVEFIVRTLWRNGERLRMTIVRDLRPHLEALARIQHLAQHDPLTGLLNRSTFMELLRERL